MAGHKAVWCVKANDGVWCAARAQRREPDVMGSVAVLCGMYVICPGGLARRRPTCPVCRKRLLGRENRRAAKAAARDAKYARLYDKLLSEGR